MSQKLAFRSFDNAEELTAAIEYLIDIAQTCAKPRKLHASEIGIELDGVPVSVDTASLYEETLTDGSIVYDIHLS